MDNWPDFAHLHIILSVLQSSSESKKETENDRSTRTNKWCQQHVHFNLVEDPVCQGRGHWDGFQSRAAPQLLLPSPPSCWHLQT